MSIPNRRSGFTLLELLVVVAVIAILTGILFPAFARARDRARQASCLSNVKQIGLAVLMYAEDYDDKYPSRPNLHQAFCAPGPDGTWEEMRTELARRPNIVPSIASLLVPYVRNKQIYLCPNDPTGDRSYRAGLWYSTRFVRCAYGGHDGMIWGFSWPTYPEGRISISNEPIAFGEVSRPSLLPIVWEYDDHHGRFRPGEARYNMAYADGHAKFALTVGWWIPNLSQRPGIWNLLNPRQPVPEEEPCNPTCAEVAARLP